MKKPSTKWEAGKQHTIKGFRVSLSKPVLVARSKGYLWFPTLARLSNGELLATMSNYADAHVKTATASFAWSRDGGLTWTKTVDGVLTDWTDPCWIALDKVYWSPDMTFPNDIVPDSAKYTVCWDPCDDLFYAAVVVEDTEHVFQSAPSWWDSSDRVEFYVQADPNGGEDWGSTAEPNDFYDKAQQYIIGYQGILPGWTWAVFGNGTYIPGDIDPGDADFEDARLARIPEERLELWTNFMNQCVALIRKLRLEEAQLVAQAQQEAGQNATGRAATAERGAAPGGSPDGGGTPGQGTGTEA